jgi:hypothetical protein
VTVQFQRVARTAMYTENQSRQQASPKSTRSTDEPAAIRCNGVDMALTHGLCPMNESPRKVFSFHSNAGSTNVQGLHERASLKDRTVIAHVTSYHL